MMKYGLFSLIWTAWSRNPSITHHSAHNRFGRHPSTSGLRSLFNNFLLNHLKRKRQIRKQWTNSFWNAETPVSFLFWLLVWSYYFLSQSGSVGNLLNPCLHVWTRLSSRLELGVPFLPWSSCGIILKMLAHCTGEFVKKMELFPRHGRPL